MIYVNLRPLNSSSKFRAFAAAGLASFVLAAGVASVLAQESLRKVVYGGTSATESKKAPPPPKKKAEPPKRTPARTSSSSSGRRPTVETAPKRRSGTATPTRRTAKKPGWIDVVFESKEPNTQIYVNGGYVGSTGEDRTFRRTMTAGNYRVRGVLGMKIVFSEKLVPLVTDGMTMTLQEIIAEKPPEPKPEPLVIPKTQAEIEMELAREMSARVLRIFSDFLDPEKSAEITTDDWRFAANAAVLGEFQNLSRQQIEAQRKFAAGKVALAEGNHQKALNDFRLAAQSFSGSPLPHIGLGDTYFAAAQWQDAKRAYEQARTVGPNLWMTNRRVADIYRILGEKKKAAPAYADAVKYGDSRYETRFLRARSLVDAENLDAAIPLLEELLNEKQSSEAYLALGEAFEMQKRDVAALDNYRKAVELNPDVPVAQYRLARIYYEQREYKKAVEGFDAALKLDGEKKSFSHEDAREKRAVASSKVRPVSR